MEIKTEPEGSDLCVLQAVRSHKSALLWAIKQHTLGHLIEVTRHMLMNVLYIH